MSTLKPRRAKKRSVSPRKRTGSDGEDIKSEYDSADDVRVGDDMVGKAKEKAPNNPMPQFTTKVPIDGFRELEMHFVHRKAQTRLVNVHDGTGPGPAVPRSEENPAPLLTSDESRVSFHVVAPSLPSFGSEGVSRPGREIPQYSKAMHRVMLNLGYSKYGMVFSPLFPSLKRLNCHRGGHWREIPHALHGLPPHQLRRGQTLGLSIFLRVLRVPPVDFVEALG
ncbi:hypothetical protein BJ875DRAFT_529370 [Amylocarpus encephaloides]|uniref:Uncharacterized protein n=1 Tax=Amylocarpus encephaloides TaxID=45428 RepID=A0A9P7YST7_9HELO|nr:hypothetical protein BJ875DRAFT_529370 [Amylocarpus encephaloides]